MPELEIYLMLLGSGSCKKNSWRSDRIRIERNQQLMRVVMLQMIRKKIDHSVFKINNTGEPLKHLRDSHQSTIQCSDLLFIFSSPAHAHVEFLNGQFHMEIDASLSPMVENRGYKSLQFHSSLSITGHYDTTNIIWVLHIDLKYP